MANVFQKALVIGVWDLAVVFGHSGGTRGESAAIASGSTIAGASDRPALVHDKQVRENVDLQ
jgi:hypothetical protein